MQNRDPRFQLRRLDVGDESPLKARSNALFQIGDLVRYLSAVTTICRCDSNSALNVWKNSSWVRSLPPKYWMSSISSTSVVSRYLARNSSMRPERTVYVLVHERLGLQVQDSPPRVVGLNLVTDRVQKVRFAEPDTAIDEQRIVLAAGWSDGTACGCGKLIRRTDDERIKHVPREQLRSGFGAIALDAALPFVPLRRAAALRAVSTLGPGFFAAGFRARSAGRRFRLRVPARFHVPRRQFPSGW